MEEISREIQARIDKENAEQKDDIKQALDTILRFLIDLDESDIEVECFLEAKDQTIVATLGLSIIDLKQQ
jgi:hypothetical protein